MKVFFFLSELGSLLCSVSGLTRHWDGVAKLSIEGYGLTLLLAAVSLSLIVGGLVQDAMYTDRA